MRKLVIHHLAKKDLQVIRNYTVKNWGLNQSKKYLIDLNATFRLIHQNPLVGVQKQEIQIGAFSFVYRNHIIYYQFDEEKVVIVAVLHQSMFLEKHLQDRLK